MKLFSLISVFTVVDMLSAAPTSLVTREGGGFGRHKDFKFKQDKDEKFSDDQKQGNGFIKDKNNIGGGQEEPNEVEAQQQLEKQPAPAQQPAPSIQVQPSALPQSPPVLISESAPFALNQEIGRAQALVAENPQALITATNTKSDIPGNTTSIVSSKTTGKIDDPVIDLQGRPRPPYSTDANQNGSESSNRGIAVGVTICILCIAAIFGGIFWMRSKREEKPQSQNHNEAPPIVEEKYLQNPIMDNNDDMSLLDVSVDMDDAFDAFKKCFQSK